MATNSMHNRLTGRMRSEVGVSLIHVAIVIFVVTAFTAFVLDQGVMLLARAQAQNVADAAALAGVTARLKEEPGDADPAVNGDTEKVIQQTVDYHSIFGGAATDTGRDWSWACPAGVVGWCVTVNVYRDGEAGNGSTALPVFFANLLGTTSQRVRATATAVAKDANGTGCLKPWMIPDRWLDINGDGDFDIGVDEYRPWDQENPTGYTDLDILAETIVVLKPGTPAGTISPSDFFEIELASDYYENIVNCQISAEVGDLIDVLPGSRVGPTNQGITDLIAAADGPVDVVIGLFSPVEFAGLDRQSGNNLPLHITNFIGVQISGMQGNQVQGKIVGAIGSDSGTAPTPTGSSSLIKTIQLVR